MRVDVFAEDYTQIMTAKHASFVMVLNCTKHSSNSGLKFVDNMKENLP